MQGVHKLIEEIIRDSTNDEFVDGTITYDEVLKSIKRLRMANQPVRMG